MNYRKLYEKKLNIKIPDGYHVHHIDCDKVNNNILNLMHMPNKLHHRYHYWRCLAMQWISVNPQLLIMSHELNSNKLIEFASVYDECQKYCLDSEILKMNKGVFSENC